MRVCRGTKLALALCTIGLVLGVAGCSGDGGDPPPFIINIIDCDLTTFAGQGVICVEFIPTGFFFGQFEILAQFQAGPGAPLETATEIPPLLQIQLGVMSSTGPFTAQTKSQITRQFCWYAGADLGFLATPGVQLFLTPVAVGTTIPVGPTASCPPFNFGGGGQTRTAVGPQIGGRAGHCAEIVDDKSVAVAGGYGLSGTTQIPLDTVRRLTFDSAGFTYTTNNFPLLMQTPRINHACSFFLDPATGRIKVLVTGGESTLPGSGPTSSADIYMFTPTEQIMPASSPMNVARSHHTATWIPSNKVVIIGGAGASGVLCSMEIWDPLAGTFQILPINLSFCRQDHTATLLPSGKILVAGGHDPLVGGALPAELVDPTAPAVMTVSGPLVDRVEHTATRLANGWVLLAGGFLATNLTSATSSAQIFEPEIGAMGGFTSVAPMMTTPRAQHAASLLGDGHALLTGGRIAGTGCPVVTPTAEVFLPATLTFTPTVPLLFPRAEHSSTATSCGFVAVIGGVLDTTCVTSFLQTVEVYPFENMNPVVETATALVTGVPGTVDIDVSITDEDADGGYVIIRWRPAGTSGMYMLATIIQQIPSTAPANFPNMQVAGIPGLGTHYAFRWNFAADALSAGQNVEIQVLPVGATLGDPVVFTTILQ
jgi:Galactose oxidase, central domain